MLATIIADIKYADQPIIHRTLQEIDFLLQVDDEARQGALRFAEKDGGPFLREEGVKRMPPPIELPKLLSAAQPAQPRPIPTALHRSRAVQTTFWLATVTMLPPTGRAVINRDISSTPC
jgi:hypothetical protein